MLAKREKVEYGKLKVNFIDITSLIRAKRISKRDKDKADVEILRKAEKIMKSQNEGQNEKI